MFSHKTYAVSVYVLSGNIMFHLYTLPWPQSQRCVVIDNMAVGAAIKNLYNTELMVCRSKGYMPRNCHVMMYYVS